MIIITDTNFKSDILCNKMHCNYMKNPKRYTDYIDLDVMLQYLSDNYDNRKSNIYKEFLNHVMFLYGKTAATDTFSYNIIEYVYNYDYQLKRFIEITQLRKYKSKYYEKLIYMIEQIYETPAIVLSSRYNEDKYYAKTYKEYIYVCLILILKIIYKIDFFIIHLYNQ